MWWVWHPWYWWACRWFPWLPRWWWTGVYGPVYWGPYGPQIVWSKEDEVRALEEESRMLRERLDTIEKRLEELKKEA